MPPATLIGVDLGGTNLRAARVDVAGRLIAVERRATPDGGPSAVFEAIAALVAALRAPDTAGVGVGVPGTYDPASGRVLNIPALPGWQDFPLRERLEESTGLPCLLENDAKAAGLGEWRVGAGRGCSNVAFVTIGTGIGGAMVVDGRLIRGAGGLAGEVGHTHVSDSTEVCACGRIGCWQAIASGTALGQRARAAVLRHPESLVGQLAEGAVITPVHVAEAARRGDPLALRLMREFAGAIGLGLINVQHCYSPERIVIGGGVSQLFEMLRPEIERTVLQGLLPGFHAAGILPAELGDDAGLVGAALLARPAFEDER